MFAKVFYLSVPTFKLYVAQVLWQIVKCHLKPLVQLFGKLPDHLSEAL